MLSSTRTSSSPVKIQIGGSRDKNSPEASTGLIKILSIGSCQSSGRYTFIHIIKKSNPNIGLSISVISFGESPFGFMSVAGYTGNRISGVRYPIFMHHSVRPKSENLLAN